MSAVPLRRSLLVRMGLLVSSAILLSGLVLFEFGMSPLIRSKAESQFAIAAAQVESDLDRFVQPVGDHLKMSRRWIGAELPPLEDPAAFNRLFIPLLETLQQAMSVVAGTSTGEGWMLLRQPQGGWLNRMTDRRRWDDRHLFFEHDAEGKQSSHWKSVDYDPRSRSWYKAAIREKNVIHWTAPYIFFTTGDLGVTASTSYVLPDGRDFVVGIDVALNDLSTTTMTAEVGKQGMALVLTDDSRVLALPRHLPGESTAIGHGLFLKHGNELGLPQLSALLKRWQPGTRSEMLNFPAGGEEWFARVSPYRLGDQRLWIVTLAPASDFAPPWSDIALPLSVGLVLMLILAGLVGYQQAKRIARPLETLARSSEKIGLLDFKIDAGEKTAISEIQQLANAHEKMRNLLQHNQHQLVSQQTTLYDQIRALGDAEAKIRDSEAYNKVLYSDSYIPLLVIDPENGQFVDCNLAAAKIHGLSCVADLVGLSPADLSPTHQYDGTLSVEACKVLFQDSPKQGNTIFEWRHRRPNGEEWDSEVHLMPFHHGGRLLIQLSVQDITLRKHSVQALEKLALYDTLTGLYNRSLFLDRLQSALLSARRKSEMVAVLFIDLDRFKEVNDSQGHTVGDDVLRTVAKRFSAVLRSDELLARLGGDEFAVVSTEVDAISVGFIAERILASLAKKMDVGNLSFQLGASIGISLYPRDGDTPDTLLRQADIAMYRAKSSGKGFVQYDPEMSSGLAESMALARELKESLSSPNGGLTLHYQPQFNLQTERLVGAEALIRWNHPALGEISPADFIPIAEARGMMNMVSDWVLREVCRQLLAWRKEGFRFAGRMAINIAAQQIEDATFPRQVSEIVRAAGLDPSLFEMELTESGMMRNVELAIELLGELRTAGFALAIDDFGTGYSSLSYLKRLPVNKLKIDKSFVRDMVDDASDHAIVATIIAMGQTLGLQTIAEGVETRAQADALLMLGCHESQGYLFGRPEPADVFSARWLSATAGQNENS